MVILITQLPIVTILLSARCFVYPITYHFVFMIIVNELGAKLNMKKLSYDEFYQGNLQDLLSVGP